MSALDRYYQILGLAPTATDEEVRRAYRDLVQVWHPDRFEGNPRLREKAAQTIREVNDAYQRICTTHPERHAEPTVPPPQPRAHRPASPPSGAQTAGRRCWAGAAWSAPLPGRAWLIGPSLSRMVVGVIAALASIALMIAPLQIASGTALRLSALLSGGRDVDAIDLSAQFTGQAQQIQAKIVDLGRAGLDADSRANATLGAAPERERRADLAGPPRGARAAATAPIKLVGPLRPEGAGTLLIRNDTDATCVAAIHRETEPHLVLGTYVVEPHGHTLVKGLGPGSFAIRFQSGVDWDGQFGRFRARRFSTKPVGPFRFTQIQAADGIRSDHFEVLLTPEQIAR